MGNLRPISQTPGHRLVHAQILARLALHDRIRYFGGNIVLATDNFIFRIHKRVLAAHSSVFKDMFEFFAPVYEDESAGALASILADSDYWGRRTSCMIGGE